MSGIGGHGVLLALMEPEDGYENEFNAWYDLEHIPQMASVGGIVSATRWVCVEGWPRYLALYDLEHNDVLSSDDYRKVTGAHFTPWSRRMLARVRGWHRFVLAGLDANAPTTCESANALHFMLLACPASARSIAAADQTSPAILQARAFALRDPGLAATLTEAGALADLAGQRDLPADRPQRLGSWRFARYHRRDPLTAFAPIHAEMPGSTDCD